MPTAFRFRRLALPLLIVLAALGWSGYWLLVQASIEREIDREVARFEASGGRFACEDRQWRGFPLRVVLSCDSTRLEMPGGAVVETAGMEAFNRLHDPRRIVARTDRLVVEGAPDWSADGRNITLAGAREQPDRLAFSASSEALTVASGRMPAIAIESLEIRGSIEGLPRTRPSDLGALLREAARLGSRVTIDALEAQLTEIKLTASGTVELGPEGPAGTLSTTVTNYDAFLADLERRGVISRRAVQASSMLIGLLQGGGKPDGEVTVALRFHEGQVFWGPFAVAQIPPLE